MRLLTENLGWKLLSLLLAIGLWMIFVGDQELVTSLPVAVQYRNLPSDLEISSDVPEKVNLEVKGTSGKLTHLDLYRTPVILNLKSVDGPGEKTFNIDREDLGLPFGVELVRATPSQIRLRFERRVSREIPVRIRVAGPPDGYSITRQEAQPDHLRILGPQSHVDRVEYAETDPVDLTGVYNFKEFRVTTYVDDSKVRFETPPTVTVRVSLRKSPGERPAKAK